MKISKTLCALSAIVSFPLFAATTITGAGSTFVYPVLSAWASNYAKTSDVQINYQAIGSGGGIAQIKAGTVDFAATDKPLSQDELNSARLTQFPLVKGTIVLSDNVKTNGLIHLDLATVADIYLGKITYWNDPAIQKLNPGLNLPHQRITPIYRADGSGTTYNFTGYLAGASSAFRSSVGSNTVVSWPTGVGAKGNAGVANFVRTIPGSIGYVEYAYAKQNNFPMINTPTMLATTYVLMIKNGKNNAALNSFFQYCFDHPEFATRLDYIPVK